MSILGTIKKHLDTQREKSKSQDALDSELREQERKEYEKQYRKASEEAILIRAKRDALEKSGLAKLRATQIVANAGKPAPSALSKLSTYTRQNMARREANLQKTELMRKAAKQEVMKRNSSKAYKPIKHGPLY